MQASIELLEQRAALVGESRAISSKAEKGNLSADDLQTMDRIEADIASLGYRARFDRFIRTGEIDELYEYRSLSADIPEEGGNIIIPQDITDRLIKKLDDVVLIRQNATKYTLTQAGSLGVPMITDDPEDPEWTSEVRPVDMDTAMQFGKRALTPNLLTKGIRVSLKLLGRAEVPVTTLVTNRLAAKFAATQERAFMTGNGEGQPLGLFTASSHGITVARDVVGTNTTTKISADTVLDVEYSLKKQYRSNAKWLLSRYAIKQCLTMKARGNKYLWQPSVALGRPDTLNGFPVIESEYVPNTFTTGQYVGLFGDLSQYWIVDQMIYTVQRLNELYAETNQVGFIGRMSLDGMPSDELAFARIKLA